MPKPKDITIDTLKELGFDISNHKPKKLEQKDLDWQDIIVVFTKEQKNYVRTNFIYGTYNAVRWYE